VAVCAQARLGRARRFDAGGRGCYASSCAPTRFPRPRVLKALELFGPQARPYNFDDMFDCWGLVRRVVDWLDDGAEANDELRADGSTDPLWRPIRGSCRALARRPSREPSAPSRRLPHGVLLRPRRRHGLVYGLVAARTGAAVRRRRAPFSTSASSSRAYMRATESTDRLRNDGGAYLRLWDGRQRFYHGLLHDRLASANRARERDLIKLRRAARPARPAVLLHGAARDRRPRP